MGYQVVEVEQQKEFIDQGIGVEYPFRRPAVFGQTFTTIEKAISNLTCLLLTRKGERVYQPELGTDLLYLLFEPNLDELKDQIINIIKEPVAFWLPYILITDINVVTAKDDPTLPHHVKISISFTISGLVDNSKIIIFADENGVLTIDSNNSSLIGNNPLGG